WAIPQTRFCTAMAMPHCSRLRPRSSVTGRVKRPKAPRVPKPMAAMMQPAMMTTESGMAGRAGATLDMANTGAMDCDNLRLPRHHAKQYCGMGVINPGDGRACRLLKKERAPSGYAGALGN